ncbi:hypothetical protein GLOIN_2v1564531 [Rhizophagus irregularis DAOM 181602=DAOM 197198]|uniref:Uncharacterized protein n=1 Tax=Rhizophagus irregularis (strain DAOM 181602 / DAOM 197198 / MUCL 43194) TaxID=747089 RepID=A0A2P4QDB5_RHIID|nr:hypothetical protein GLOIN_2v1564531 [Rhizophagus irregularis DAOM 181602=DAOM 197198]POG75632.1 hypothetical protein GLOIN_2v1564531 [Rhizophagus irregularis DAOM 181602=DAOM 197198]|eukprot:XP_025182498.1 hypothetical protein GLOIN_2v1564531 [Rhizophagus irregularis DAOM 181602=DAOM 197198]
MTTFDSSIGLVKISTIGSIRKIFIIIMMITMSLNLIFAVIIDVVAKIFYSFFLEFICGRWWRHILLRYLIHIILWSFICYFCT